MMQEKKENSEENPLLFMKEDFDEHLEDDMILLMEWLSVIRECLKQYALQVLENLYKYKSKNTNTFHMIGFIVMFLLFNQISQYSENSKLKSHIKYLDHQILMNKLDKAIQTTNRTLNEAKFYGNGLYKLIDKYSQPKIESESETSMNALIYLNDDVYMLNKNLNNRNHRRGLMMEDEGNHLKLESVLQFGSTRFNAGMNVMNVTSIDELNDLRTVMNIRMPDSYSTKTYNLMIRLSVERSDDLIN